MGIDLSLFCCHTGDFELDSFGVRSTELGSSSSGSDPTERGFSETVPNEPESSEFVSTEYESTEPGTVASERVEDVPLRQWPMDDERLMATLYGSRCVLTGELVPRDSFVVMETHPILVSPGNDLDLRAQY